MAHANARLGPAGRRELVRLMIEIKMPERQAAACLSVSPCTAHRWKTRWLSASDQERRSGRWALDRSSRPHRSPRRTSAEVEARVCAARERTGWGPRLIAGETGVAHSTVHAILRRHGRSRAPRAAERAFVRYEWPCPGDLLHMDVKRYPRFRRPGHAVTGDRRKTHYEKTHRLGHDYFHAIVDDHSRMAYGELLDDERADTVSAFVARALAWFDARGIRAQRVMTDGAWSYTHNRALRELFAHRDIRHIVTPPYTPRWNGKVERFHQTMEREWAKGLRYRDHHARNAALPHWLAHYNERRPHSSLGGRSPISRAHNLSRHDS
jgi:transposase InsO family protein